MKYSYAGQISGLFRKLDQSGAAILEFALVAPVLLLVLVGIINGASLLVKQNAMHNGVMTAAQYIMRGGNDLGTARTIGYSAWSGHSSSATVNADKTCYCGGSAGDCSKLCTDGSVPDAAVIITAKDTVQILFTPTSISTQQQIRVR